MTQITILKNTIIKGKRYTAEQIVDVDEDIAKKVCEKELALPLYAEDLPKMGFDPLDPESLCDENGQPIEQETEEEPKADEQPEEQETPETPIEQEEPKEPKAKKTTKKSGKKDK